MPDETQIPHSISNSHHPATEGGTCMEKAMSFELHQSDCLEA